MRDHEVEQAFEVINTAWPNKEPLAKAAAALWGVELRRYKVDDVMRVLMALVKSSNWRPSLAEILKPLAPASSVKSASAAFETVCEQIGNRPHVVSDLEERAVKRLGGWDVIGMWPTARREWHFRDFRVHYDDLVETDRATELRAVAGGRQQALPTGGPS